MRNGKHESNSPSRFIREVDPQYISNPIVADSHSDDRDADASFGWGRKPADRPSRFGGNTYGRSGAVRTEKPSRPAVPVARPEISRSSGPVPVRRPQPVASRTVDSDFVPTPILQLKAGQRIEHNRFGYGNIVEISGNPADLKAKIRFDDHGEKILILKYAKIRAVDVAK